MLAWPLEPDVNTPACLETQGEVVLIHMRFTCPYDIGYNSRLNRNGPVAMSKRMRALLISGALAVGPAIALNAITKASRPP
jgi:hypothetical protein